MTPTHPSRFGVRARAAAALSALTLAALSLSGCGALIQAGHKATPSNSAATGSGNFEKDAEKAIKELENSTSKAYGTEGMAPLKSIAPVVESAAYDLGADPAKDERWKKFYDQRADWGKCERAEYQGAECATIEVPLKWNDPEGATLSLLLTRVPATGDDKKGSLLLNPGGPGGSGAEHVAAYGSMTISSTVRKQYDLIGFDPRGVKDSDGVQCLDDAETDEMLSTDIPDTEEGKKKAKEWADKLAKACKAKSSDRIQYVDTYSAARDMDVIRSAVESEKLDYLGFSYGTYLGATYAEMYPERTGHLILDGAMDPALTTNEIVAGQAAGFEQAIKDFVTWCQNERGTCPLTGSVDEGIQQLRDFMTNAGKNPIPTASGRKLNETLASTAILTALYSNETWEYVALGIESAKNNNSADVLLMLADLANEREEDGTFKSNSTFANVAVNCLDHIGVTDEKWLKAESERLAKKYPTFGPSLGTEEDGCANWPAKPVRYPKEIHAKGSSTIVVIGTTHDPATPYAWAESLNKQLDNSVLLTWEGFGHTAYSRSGGCIEEMVDAYLLEDKVPDDGAKCE
ncbi:alpha/beta hydrolase [Dermabacter sp.]|uniref:alpha/beta hydrolase n=1 Tax=Dermabacter sp. TaxID=37640 RepID=UPI002906CB90|nr:alpha/beta hydrolase [Dermabacter sp.]MDU4923652.1 alpha/beta hydrolase [Dermabacter sp.]